MDKNSIGEITIIFMKKKAEQNINKLSQKIKKNKILQDCEI
jgi:hypothetical protein